MAGWAEEGGHTGRIVEVLWKDEERSERRLVRLRGSALCRCQCR